MMNRVLYFGDGTLAGSARYLAGVMTYYKIPFDHVPTARRFTGKTLRHRYSLFVLSDYPSRNLPRSIQREMVQKVREGTGFLMIGGWSSFTGVDGRYRGTPIADILPVMLSQKDDRMNAAGGAVVYLKKHHSVFKGLSFRSAPVVAGFNRVTAKPSSEVLLGARKILPRYPNIMLEKKSYPFLIFSRYGKGKVAAVTTDVAPHWVGSFVDWGKRRVHIPFSKGIDIEVGENYLKFFGKLIRFLA